MRLLLCLLCGFFTLLFFALFPCLPLLVVSFHEVLITHVHCIQLCLKFLLIPAWSFWSRGWSWTAGSGWCCAKSSFGLSKSQRKDKKAKRLHFRICAVD